MTLAAIIAFSAFLALAPPSPEQPQTTTAAQEVQPPTGPGSDSAAPEDPTVPLTEHKAPPPEPAPQVSGKPEIQPETPATKETQPSKQPADNSASSSATKEPAKKSSPAPKKKKSRKTTRKPPTIAQNSGEPVRKVVRNGSTQDPELEFVPGVTATQASRQRQDTERLLGIADANLKRSSARTLTPSQQDTMNQIKMYMEQSKQAAAAGDLQRAHNLAFKAQLLSNELVRH